VPAAGGRRARRVAGASRRAACQPHFSLNLVQRGADFLIAVKHRRRKGLRLIRDRLTCGSRIPWRTSTKEVKQCRDIVCILRAMRAPAWVVEQWPGSAMIIAVRSHSISEGKPTDETSY